MSQNAMKTRIVTIAAAISVAGGALSSAGEVQAATLPEIRIHGGNQVPACVTPQRLMAFLERRNPALPPRFRNIASFYKAHGETWRVRWDYAFFQMALETNFLTYRRPDGRMGDVDPRQNNFAGIGTTGGGVPGDSFPDVTTGVLGQIQHLVVYSGEPVLQPVAPRTQLKQEHILLRSRQLARSVRFSDLARRWAADPKYGSSIEWVAQSYRNEFCRGSPAQNTGGPAWGSAPLRPSQPMLAPAPVEVLPWANKPLAPRADGASDLTTGTVVRVADSGGSSPVRTIWSRAATAPAKKHSSDLADILAKTVISATESDPEQPQAGAVTAERATTPSASSASPDAPAQASDEGDAHFALFTPPALLARALPADTAPSAAEGAPPQARDVAIAGGESKAVFDPIANPPSGLGMAAVAASAEAQGCHVETASFGGQRAVLVRSTGAEGVHYIAVTVLEGFEKSMTRTFIASRPQGGEAIGEFENRDAALAKARELCAAR